MNQNVNHATPDLGGLLILLLKGVLYQDDDGKRWTHLLNLQNRVRDYVTLLGLELILDEAEGYAFLRSRPQENLDDDSQIQELPRLIARRQLSFPVSLLLALLRKKLAEFDAGGGDTRLVLTRDDMVELLRLFLPESSNESRLVDQIERHIGQVVDLGFLRKMKSGDSKTPPTYEVRRIIKAFVDAQWLSEFDARLEGYRRQLAERETQHE